MNLEELDMFVTATEMSGEVERLRALVRELADGWEQDTEDQGALVYVPKGSKVAVTVGSLIARARAAVKP